MTYLEETQENELIKLEKEEELNHKVSESSLTLLDSNYLLLL